MFFVWMFWAFVRRRRRPVLPVEDGPPAEPYRVYTRAYDLILPARDVPATLASDAFLRARDWLLRDPDIWHRKTGAARIASTGIDCDGRLAADLRSAFEDGADQWAIAILVDQSGSMKDGPILHAAATLRWLSDRLGMLGVACALLGFSTVGWQGGRARQHWLWHGQPKRPGRLAALLHVIYQPFGMAMSEEDWAVMTHPDLLRENVDGEAIEWAVSLLAERPEPRHLLIILSDGAPVDDATLMHNGSSYLWRHLNQVIAACETAPGLTLGAVGLNYRVDELYSRSRSATDPADLPVALAELIAEAVRDQIGQS